MHSVLVVDDEPFVRLSIASLAPWGDDRDAGNDNHEGNQHRDGNGGFDFLAEAGNGAEALVVLAAHPEIDIVLLDLSMPVLDGLAFLRQLAAEAPSRAPAVIVLSAHDDYHLVREAFRLGARDYLVKSELDAAALGAVLTRVAAQLEPSEARAAAVVQRRHAAFVKAQLLRDALAAPASFELADALAGLGAALAPGFFVCCFWVDDIAAVAEREGDRGLSPFADLALRSLAQALARWGRGEIVPLSPGHIVALFVEDDAAAPRARAFCRDAVEYLARGLNVTLSFAIGPPCSSLGRAADAYRTAQAARTVESRIVVLAKRAIHEHFADLTFSLEDASARAGVSKNHLSFEFSRETGETFVQYLSRVRVEAAKRLLVTTSLLVHEVAERVGYPNVEHFSRLFKKLVGTSPARFRESHAGHAGSPAVR